MKEYLQRLPKDIQGLIKLSARLAASDKFKAFLVGGFVRDLILGVKNLDLDIVIEGDGIKFAEALADLLGARLVRHGRFGTATVDAGELKIDIASARVECYPEPACLPSVSRGTIMDDLKRRDFSINAMAISINKKDYGRLLDFFDGKLDIGRKKIRALHALSFIDDPTRILRAIRFERRYGFSFEQKTLKLLKEAAQEKMLEQVQPHRLRDELILILKERQPVKQIRRVRNLVSFDFVHQDLSVTKKTFELLVSIQKQVHWFKKSYPQRRHLEVWIIYFFGLIDSLDTRNIRQLCRKFAFRKGDEKRMLSLKSINGGFIRKLSAPDIKPSAIFDLLEHLSYEVIIAIRAKYKSLVIQRNIADFLEVYNGMRLYVSGDDLHGMGIPPGSHYRKIFSRVLKAKLNGLVKTKEEELTLIKRLTKIDDK